MILPPLLATSPPPKKNRIFLCCLDYPNPYVMLQYTLGIAVISNNSVRIQYA